MNWVIKFGRIKRIMIGPLALLVILWLVDVMSHGKIQQHQQSADISALQNPKQVKRRGNNVLFAVYSANTPSGKQMFESIHVYLSLFVDGFKARV